MYYYINLPICHSDSGCEMDEETENSPLSPMSLNAQILPAQKPDPLRQRPIIDSEAESTDDDAYLISRPELRKRLSFQQKHAQKRSNAAGNSDAEATGNDKPAIPPPPAAPKRQITPANTTKRELERWVQIPLNLRIDGPKPGDLGLWRASATVVAMGLPTPASRAVEVEQLEFYTDENDHRVMEWNGSVSDVDDEGTPVAEVLRVNVRLTES